MTVADGRELDSEPDRGVGRRARRSSTETREHLLRVAAEMFYAEGIHATGVDALAARAGVAPTTLYRLFASKDALVTAYVEHCSDRYRTVLGAAAAGDGRSAQERILAVFDAFAAEVGSGSCRGCPFLMVLAEFPEPGSPAHRAAVAHKEWLRALLHRLVGELAATAPGRDFSELGEHLVLVAEGVYGSRQSLGPGGPSAHGRAVAAALLDAAGRPTEGTEDKRWR